MFKKKDKKRKVKRNRYVGKLPVNSRITIDYTKKKPSVKFSYPRKNAAYQVIFTFPTIMPAMIITVILILFLQSTSETLAPAINYPEMDDCNIYYLHSQNETYIRGVSLECVIDGKFYEMNTILNRGEAFFFFKNPPQLESNPGILSPLKNHAQFAISGIMGILLLLIFPLCIWLMYLFYTRTKFGQRIFPELSKAVSDARYYTKFNKVPLNKQIEIPLFSNTYLDYKATKGFSKNLLQMKIVEHPFTQIVRKGKTKKKITKTTKQVYLWKATFYFKDIPKDGSLEVWWT